MSGGYIFDIQGYSVHDGPGCRTLVFLKGCRLNCRWCSNPEGIQSFPLPLYNADKCLFDSLCVNACPENAITSNEKSLTFNRTLCADCISYKCTKACNTGAVKVAGYYISTNELLERLQKDRNYWGKDGGITLTGGEPLYQADFAKDILKKCYESYIHTAIETCGNIHWQYYEKAIEFLDLIFFDIKHIDAAKHNEWTGADNKLILENIAKLVKHFKGRIIIRLPVIPGFNDKDDEIESIADFMNRTGLNEINILPLHHLGSEKYKLLGIPYKVSHDIPSPALLNHIQSLFTAKGIHCYNNYMTPF